MTKKVKLVGGTVESAELEPEDVQGVVTKLMKVIAIERKPGQRIAWIELKVQAGTYQIHIDEATVRAMMTVFDEPSQPSVDEVLDALSGAE